MSLSVAPIDARSMPRDEIHYRARAFGPDAQPLSLLIVNLSAQGLMARCGTDLPPGTRLHVCLPVVGGVPAEVRWSHDGRIGCELDRTICLADYYELLTALVRGR